MHVHVMYVYSVKNILLFSIVILDVRFNLFNVKSSFLCNTFQNLSTKIKGNF